MAGKKKRRVITDDTAVSLGDLRSITGQQHYTIMHIILLNRIPYQTEGTTIKVIIKDIAEYMPILRFSPHLLSSNCEFEEVVPV